MANQMAIGVRQEDNTKRNVLVGAGVGALAGAGYGATAGAPAKYSSYAELVEEATNNDNFKLAKLADDAAEETKTAHKTLSDSIADTKQKLAGVADLFKAEEGSTAPETKTLAEVAEKLGVSGVPTLSEGKTMEQAINELGQKKSLAEMLGKIAKDGEISITEEMKNVFKKGETAGTEDQVKAAWKAIVGTDFADNAKMTDDNLKAINKFVADNSGILDLASKGTVNEGAITLTEAQAKSAVKEGSQAAQDAVGKLGKLLGTNKLTGAIKWGAAGLVVLGAVAWVASKFFGNKEAA